jgi:hypothetical protein
MERGVVLPLTMRHVNIRRVDRTTSDRAKERKEECGLTHLRDFDDEKWIR